MLHLALLAALLAAKPAPPAWPFPSTTPADSAVQPRELGGAAGREVSALHGLDPGWTLHGASWGAVFVPAHALDVAAAGPWLFVASNTGLWVHDAATLARRGQLRRGQVLRVAASPDGKLLAFAVAASRGVEIDVVALPSLESRVRVQLPAAGHLRFSDDGGRLVVAGGEQVAVVSMKDGAAQALSVGEDVNDAAPVPGHPELVAAAHDGDSVDLLPLAGGAPLIRTEPLIRAYWEHVEAHPRTFLEVFTPRPSRDQRACVFDPRSGALYGGGDDNVVWRVERPLAAPRLTRFAELDGNVVALDAVPGLVFAATDEPVLAAIDARGLLGTFHAEYHTGSAAGDYKDARLAASGEAVFAALDGFAVRWRPGRKALVAREYARAQGVTALVGAVDSVLLIRDDLGRANLQRVPAGPDSDDVETQPLGSLPAFPAPLELAGGDRLFVGGSRAVLLPAGGKLGRPIALPFAEQAVAVRPDGLEVAVMSRKGELATITREGKLERRPRLKGHGSQLFWDARAGGWARTGE